MANAGPSSTRFGSQGLFLAGLGLRRFAGQPLVVVFADSWTLPCASLREELSAELRGLGAVLFVIIREGVWSFQADDAARLVLEKVPSAELCALHAAYGVPKDEDGASLILLDGTGNLRSCTRVPAALDLARSLVDTLRVAIVEVLAAPRAGLVSRRELVVASLITAFALLLADGCHPRHAPSSALSDAGSAPPPSELDVSLLVNGTQRQLRLEPRTSLLDALRERLSLTGSKKGCDHGQCGACTVLLDGRRVNACLVLAVMAEGVPITTIEGLAQGETLHPMQAAFVSEDALQCGYCTPGQIMSAVGLVREKRAHTEQDLREQMSGNLCRCGAYANIVAAIRQVQKSGAPI
ncbi:MAG TPA: 2Fe-2S iron-sulfur cluster-binding protein [Polyangiaceae bacterium]